MPCAWPVTEDMKNPDHRPVATVKANFVGEIVAVVVADSRYAAADAVEAVVVDYDPLAGGGRPRGRPLGLAVDPRRPRHEHVTTPGS